MCWCRAQGGVLSVYGTAVVIRSTFKSNSAGNKVSLMRHPRSSVIRPAMAISGWCFVHLRKLNRDRFVLSAQHSFSGECAIQRSCSRHIVSGRGPSCTTQELPNSSAARSRTRSEILTLFRHRPVCPLRCGLPISRSRTRRPKQYRHPLPTPCSCATAWG